MRIHSPQITGSAANTNIVLTTITSSISVLSSSFADTASFVVSSSNDAAQNTRLSVIESVTGSFASTSSFGAYTASNDLVNVTQSSRLSIIESVTGSYATTSSFGTYTASNDLTNTTQSARLSTIESVTGSYATTGSNVFKSSQTITGSLTITSDLIVLGSSSINYVSQSTLNIGTNLVTVNAQNPSIRFGGLAVIDSGSSPQRSGSLLFDSTNDQWVFVHQNQPTVTSSILLMGPQTYDNLGNETAPTVNRLLKSVNAEHLGDSNITDTGTKVSINSNTEVTGSLISTDGFTGSLFGTSSYASQANSASFALTASYISGSGGGVGFPFSGSAIITGSLFVSGSTISGSFKGDGSQITGLTAGGKIHTQTSAASTWTVSHNLGVQYPNVTVYNSANEVIIPQTITATDVNTLTLTFGSAVAGYAISGIGGIINVQGRTTQQYFAAATTWSFAHNLGDKYVSIQAFDDAFEMMIPTTIRLVDFTSSVLLFDSASSGYAVATIGGDLPAISSSYAGYTLQVSSTAPYSASWVAVPNVTVTTAVSSSFAATASSADNLTVRGTLTAQTINVQTITSSIEYVTGSTRNGSLSSNTHQFTGSVLITGSADALLNINNGVLYVSASGNVGIGINTPSGGISGNELALHLAHSNVSVLALQSTAVSGKKWQIYSSNDGGLYFRDGTAGTQVLFLSSNGRVGIGTTSPDTVLTVYGANVSTANASAIANVYTTTGYGADVGGSIGLGGYYNTTANITYANLHGKKENATLNDSNGYFAVSVRSGTDGTVERMRISSNGNVGIGTTGAGRRLSVASAAATQTLFVHNQRNISGDYGLTMQLGGNTNNASSYYMFCDTDAVGIRMVVYGNGNVANVNNSYGAYSDIKLKENITDATPKLDDLLKVKIRNYNLIADENKTKQIGIIAQELEEVFPGLIEESDDTVKNEETGEPIKTGTTTKSVKYSVFVPMLIKAVQELKAENDTLKEILQRNNIQ